MDNKLGIIPANETETYIFKKRRKMPITSFWTKINSLDLRDSEDGMPKSYGRKRAETIGTSLEAKGRIRNLRKVEIKGVHNHSTKMHFCWRISVINERNYWLHDTRYRCCVSLDTVGILYFFYLFTLISVSTTLHYVHLKFQIKYGARQGHQMRDLSWDALLRRETGV